MLGFINKHGILSSKQFGSQPQKKPLIKYTEILRKFIDIREEGQAFFVDIRNAFATINHDILLTLYILFTL